MLLPAILLIYPKRSIRSLKFSHLRVDYITVTFVSVVETEDTEFLVFDREMTKFSTLGVDIERRLALLTTAPAA